MKHADIVQAELILAPVLEEQKAAPAVIVQAAPSQEELQQVQVIAQMQMELIEKRKVETAAFKQQLGMWVW